MSKRYNHYHIKVDFSISNKECAIGNVYAKYLNGKDNEDSFHFYLQSFTLIASRSKSYEDGTILSNNGNSINKQLLKGLLYYYSIATSFPKISKVSIIRKRAKSADFNYTLDCANIIQPIIPDNDNPYSFNKEVLKEIFNESERGDAYRIALSYWLKGIASSERYYKFDHFWRAFNRLYLYHANTEKDFDGMKHMRQCIIDNPRMFPLTLRMINSYTPIDLRKFRWRSLILNDYDTFKKTAAFKDFVLRYNDERIMNLFKDVLPYREEYLKNANLYNDVVSHINQAPIRKDCELITLLSIKYAYFVRNKIFHGEIPDSTFKIHDDYIDDEIDNLNGILSTLIFEIINGNLLRI